jgi:hypothetical protein
VTVAAGAAITADRGLRARYFADADARGPIERSTEYRSQSFTRIDDRLDFNPRGPEFPLWFFNDIGRFNFAPGSGTDRRQLPFAAIWDGQWRIDRPTTRLTYVDAPGASAELVVDDSRVAAVAPGSAASTATVSLAPGWHRLFVRFSSPSGSPRRFSVGQIIDGRRVPFDAGDVMTRSLEPWQRVLATMVRIVRTVFDVAAIAWLALLVVRDLRDLRRGCRGDGSAMTVRQQAFAWFAVVAILDAFVVASPWSTRLWLLAGGDDPLTYESYARDIQLHGLLLRGIDGPYYYQVLYPYFLAAVHRLFGEGMFGPLFVQRVLQASVVWSIVDVATYIAGTGVWPAAMGVAGVFVYAKLTETATAQSTESLFIPLLAAWTAMVVRFCVAGLSRRSSPDESRRPKADVVQPGVTGIVGGLAALTRTTALLGWIAVVPVCWIAWRRTPGRVRSIALMTACACAVMACISIRNWIVVRHFVPMPTEFSITLLGGNEPPRGLALDFTRRGPLYDRLGINSVTRTVVEYAIAAPRAFAENMGRKALFALGIFEPYAPGFGYSAVLASIWIAGLTGLVVAVRRGVVPRSVAALPALVALTQCAAVVIVYPKGERLILPFYTLLVPYAAVAVDAAARAIVGAADRARPEAWTLRPRTAFLAAAALLLCVAGYTFAIRTRGITDHFLMLSEQIRDWDLARGPFSGLPLVGTPSTVGGNSFGPVYYWILWIVRVAIGRLFDNLPHAGGIGLAAMQSMADIVLLAGVRKASGSWIFAVAAVLIIASSPFDLALSSVIWNPVVAIAFAKIATGLVLYWGEALTRTRRVVLALAAWFAVQAHSGALPFAAAIFAWILWTEIRSGPRPLVIAAVEIVCAIAVLQLPSMLAHASVQPTKMLDSLRHPEPLRIGDAFRAVCAAVESIGFAPLPISQASIVLLAAGTAVLLLLGRPNVVAAVTVMPIACAVATWSLWQGDYDAYRFLTIVPAGLLMILWPARAVSRRSGRAVLALALLVAALLVQKPRIDNSMLVFRMPGYGALVRGSREMLRRGEPIRHIEAPFLNPLSNPEYVFTLLGGRISPDSPTIARLSETGEVTYVR